MPNKNTLVLLGSGLIALGFFVSGILDILDYFIVKALLFLAFGALAIYLFIAVTRSSKSNKHELRQHKTTSSDQT